MTIATNAALLWTRTILAQFDEGIDWAQSDIDEFFRLTRKGQKELVATSIEMFAVILEETARLGANVYVSMRIPLPERADLPLTQLSIDALIALADFTGDLRGKSVPGFVIDKRTPPLWPSNAVEFRALVDADLAFARPASTTLELRRGQGDGPFDTDLVFTAFATEQPSVESTYVTL